MISGMGHLPSPTDPTFQNLVVDPPGIVGIEGRSPGFQCGHHADLVSGANWAAKWHARWPP